MTDVFNPNPDPTCEEQLQAAMKEIKDLRQRVQTLEIQFQSHVRVCGNFSSGSGGGFSRE